MRVISQVGEWFDRRFAIGGAIRETTEHPVREARSWFLCFRQRALVVFMLQWYRDFAGDRLRSFRGRGVEQPAMLNHDITLGWFIRALHGWGSNFMVAIVLIHMVQVFLFGAYKFPGS